MPGEPPGPLVGSGLAGSGLAGSGLAGSGLAGSGLVGRAAEIASVRRMLDDARLVTVTGLPGAGKTAVGLAAASAAAESFADGSLLLRLDTLRDEVLLPHTISAALQLPDQFTHRPLEVLTDQLRDRHLLLVLDTCEHLLGACANLVAALLPLCPKVQVLATSREPLRVPGEAAVAVRPLGLADAVRLFGQRAAQVGVEIAPQDRAAVASICVQLDKLPLAIELATAELAELSLAELLARLEAGHVNQTLRAAIGWSHELCTPSERLLWARLSVFTGPFGPRDAQDVCTTRQLPDETVAAGLILLAERSLLLPDRKAGARQADRKAGAQQADHSPRFLLPATLRAYGRQMLRRLGQDEEFTARHQHWQDGRRHHHGTPAGK
jgi:predicted ATPase